MHPPHHSEQLLLSYPAPHVLQITFNRPKQLNAMGQQITNDLKHVLDWFDKDPELWCCVVTGAGRAFCAGADLKAWNESKQEGQSAVANEQEGVASSPHGFGALSRRSVSSKPIIAAVNGLAFGGGLEIVMNCDIVIASQDAKFGFPEVKRGVVVAQGAIPRVAAISGHQLASELLFIGQPISAQEAKDRFRFVNHVVPAQQALPVAIEWAKEITENSPDAVASTKRGILMGKQFAGIEPSTIAHAWSIESKRVYEGENIREGLRAFVEKRKPQWKNPAKL